MCIVHTVVPCLGHMNGPFSMQRVPLPLGAGGIPKEQLHVPVICELHNVTLSVLVVQSDVVVHHGLPMHGEGVGGGGGGGHKQKERSRGLGAVPPFMQSTTCRSCRACTIPQLIEIECAHVGMGVVRAREKVAKWIHL